MFLKLFNKIPHDKKLHFIAGAIITLITSIGVSFLGANDLVVTGSGFLMGTIVGFIKELIDRFDNRSNTHFDPMDAVWTMFGSFIAAIVVYIVLIAGKLAMIMPIVPPVVK